MAIVHEVSNMSRAVHESPTRFTAGIDSDTDSDPDADGNKKQLSAVFPAPCLRASSRRRVVSPDARSLAVSGKRSDVRGQRKPGLWTE